MTRNFFPLMDAASDALAAGGGGQAGATAGGDGGKAAAAAAPAPYYADLFGKDGTINHASFERLPDNLKPLGPTLANMKNADDLLGKIAHLNTLAGRKGLAPLPADAKPEDIAAQTAILRAVNGVPEKAEGYGFTRPDDLPEAAWSEAGAKAAMAIMHKHNISPAAAKDLLALQVATTKENIQAQQQYEQDFYKAQDAQFREALTKSGDDYDKVTAIVTQTAEKFGIKADNPILKNADARLLLFQVAKATGEPTVKTGAGGDLQTKSARSVADAIVHDKANPDYEAYWKPEHAKNKEVKARVAQLYEEAEKADAAARAAAGKR